MLFFIPAEMSALVFFASSGCSLDTFFGCSGCSCALSTSAGVRKKATAAAKTSRVNIKVIPPYCALRHHSLHVSVRQRRSDYRCCRPVSRYLKRAEETMPIFYRQLKEPIDLFCFSSFTPWTV